MGQAVLITSVQTLILSIIVYLINSWLNTKYQEKVEDYKTKLNLLLENHKLNLSTDLERFKSELVLNVNRQGKLYERRALVIDELHRKVIEVQGHLQYMVSAKPLYENEDGKAKQKESEDKAQLILTDFNNSVMFNLHYFNKAHADLLDKIRTDARQMNADFFAPRLHDAMFGEHLPNEERAKAFKRMIDASEKIVTELPAAIAMLEDEFRKLTGVED